MDMKKEEEFNFLKMDVRERCAALNNKLEQMTFTEFKHADNQERLCCTALVKDRLFVKGGYSSSDLVAIGHTQFADAVE
jgi:hypothetical protein